MSKGMIQKSQPNTEVLINFADLADITRVLQKTIKAEITPHTNQEKDDLSDLEITHFVDNFFLIDKKDSLKKCHYKELSERLSFVRGLFLEQYAEQPTVYFDKHGASVLLIYYLVYIWSKKYNNKKDKFLLEKPYNKNSPAFLKLCEERGVTGKNFC